VQVDELKKELLKAVAIGKQEEIFQKAEALESLNVMDASVAGRWSLVFSTQTDPSDTQEETLFSVVTAALYRVFFRFAPFLAGAQDTPKISLGPVSLTVGNEQMVDLVSKRVDNRVALRFKGEGPNFNLRVKGELGGEDAKDLEVTFTSFGLEWPNLPQLELPLPRPVGRLRTNFCDKTLRLSRGGRGGLFILKRLD